VPLYRDEDKGEVILDKPSPKIATTMSSSEGSQLKTITNSPKQGKSPFSLSQYKLAAFVGPISTNIVTTLFLFYCSQTQLVNKLIPIVFSSRQTISTKD
jgi:hypothetical protein